MTATRFKPIISIGKCKGVGEGAVLKETQTLSQDKKYG